MPRPDCDDDLTVFAVPEPLRSYASGAALTVGLRADCLRLHSVETPPSDGASRSPAGTLPDGNVGAAVALLIGMLGSFALNRAGIIGCVEFAEQSRTDMYLTLNRLQQTTTAPHFDATCRQCQLDVFFRVPSPHAVERVT